MTKPDGLRPSTFTRRHLLAGTAGLAVTGFAGARSRAQDRPPIAKPDPNHGAWLAIGTKPLPLAPGEPAVNAVAFPSFGGWVRNAPFNLAIKNDLAQGIVLDFGGLNPPQADPLGRLIRIAPGETFNRQVTFKDAGAVVYDLRLPGGDQPMPASAIAIVDSNDPPIDSDQMLLIEDFRQAADGKLLAPGRPGAVIKTTFTVNRKLAQDIPARTNQRLRLRFVNGCQRQPIALRIEDHDVTVVAIDGQPSEPFPARDGQLILAPGTRIDVMVDVLKAPGARTAILLHDGQSARPIAHLVYGAEPARSKLPDPVTPVASNGLPDKLDLKSAHRSDVVFGAASADWSEFAAFEARRPAPAFTVKRNRTVVLALANQGAIPATFRLHGHHFRLLDRLDDGWKPFWQDRLLFQPGETHRIAFQPQQAGGFLLEAMGAEWSAPKLLRWFKVE
jgi:FtsP/CotA-like multicopper oxidase with cupredoxin domain